MCSADLKWLWQIIVHMGGLSLSVVWFCRSYHYESLPDVALSLTVFFTATLNYRNGAGAAFQKSCSSDNCPYDHDKRCFCSAAAKTDAD